MRVTLIGADFEENIGVGMIAAAAMEAGHEVDVVPFNTPDQAAEVARRALAGRPDVVGLSIQFQHRAHEFLGLSRRLRAAGFEGHVTSGGQFPTMAWREVLAGQHGVDSVVLHEGERTFVELLDALESSRRTAEIPGLAVLSDDGVPLRTEPRRLIEDLDELPFSVRYREHDRHFGVPFIPIMGGRGCWGNCVYCSITSFYRDAREHGGGKLLRQRSPKDVAAEMAVLWHRAKGPCLYCFHDDNFLSPRPSDTLERVRAIRAELDGFGVGKIGMIGKARPDTVTPELMRELRALGVIRLYIGVENASVEGGAHLSRGKQGQRIRAALSACKDAGIFACYNLLIFEPETTLGHVRENIAFIRDHRGHPVNFCRAEPYFGTPLHRGMERAGDLGGSYLGFNYRMRDDRAELLFRVCASAFRERNFAAYGVANRTMGLGYGMNVLEHFHDDRPEWVGKLRRRVDNVTEGITSESADFLERALDLVEDADPGDWDRVERSTVLLGLEIAAADGRWHHTLDRLYAEMNEVEAKRKEQSDPLAASRQQLSRLAKAVALTASLGLGLSTLEACGCSDPLPGDAGMDATVADPPPPDAGMDSMVADPPPSDAGMDSMVADPPPSDAGIDAPFVADPPPPDAGVDAPLVADPAPFDAGMSALEPELRQRLDVIDQWRDTTPRRARRTDDIPFYDPPDIQLALELDGERVLATIEGGPESMSTRWRADGEILGEGRSVAWIPAHPDDRLRVAVRSRGGVAVVSRGVSDCGWQAPPRSS